jgi:hypothetical protein
LKEDINQFSGVHDSSQFLRFSNLVEIITATVASFGDENEANHKQVLRKLMNKLPDLKMHWAIHAEQHQSRNTTLNVFLDWVNLPNYIASTIDLGATKQIKHINHTKYRDASYNNVKNSIKSHQKCTSSKEIKSLRYASSHDLRMISDNVKAG